MEYAGLGLVLSIGLLSKMLWFTTGSWFIVSLGLLVL